MIALSALLEGLICGCACGGAAGLLAWAEAGTAKAAAASMSAVEVMSFMRLASPVAADQAAANDGGALDLEWCEAKFLGKFALNGL